MVKRQSTAMAAVEDKVKKVRMSRASGVTITTREDDDADGDRSEELNSLIDNLDGEDNATE